MNSERQQANQAEKDTLTRYTYRILTVARISLALSLSLSLSSHRLPIVEQLRETSSVLAARG